MLEIPELGKEEHDNEEVKLFKEKIKEIHKRKLD